MTPWRDKFWVRIPIAAAVTEGVQFGAYLFFPNQNNMAQLAFVLWFGSAFLAGFISDRWFASLASPGAFWVVGAISVAIRAVTSNNQMALVKATQPIQPQANLTYSVPDQICLTVIISLP